MKTIEHEGQTFVLKTDMESAIQNRLQKMSLRAAEAENQTKQLQEELDNVSGRLGTIDTLQAQIEDYKTKVEQANGRFSRFQAVSKHGLNDPEQIELVEWQFDRVMSKRAKKDQQPLTEWLAGIVADPATAPIALRPHLVAIAERAPSAAPEQTEPTTQTIRPDTPLTVPTPPRLNQGAISAPAQNDSIMERGMRDLDFYRENRDAIRQAYINNNRR